MSVPDKAQSDVNVDAQARQFMRHGIPHCLMKMWNEKKSFVDVTPGMVESYICDAVKLSREYNITTLLSTPSKQLRHLYEISDQIATKIHQRPLIECFFDYKRKVNYISQIKLNFDENLNLMDNNESDKLWLENEKSHKDVIYYSNSQLPTAVYEPCKEGDTYELPNNPKSTIETEPTTSKTTK